MSNVRTIYFGKNDVTCKCGNKAIPGEKFWYKSKYDDTVIEGVILNAEYGKITSTKKVTYPCSEIEVRPMDIIRADRLSDLGI